MEDLRCLFEESGLTAPPVPAALKPRLRERGPWVFATREIDAMAMYSFDRYLVEAVAGPIEDYVAVSHAGHGANSYGLSYHLVYGPVAIFAQTGWGGAYMDADESDAEASRQLAQCAELIATTEKSVERLPASPARLIVTESGFRASGICKWLDRPLGDEHAAEGWLREAAANDGPDLGIEEEPKLSEPFAAIAAAIKLVQASK